MIGNKLHIVAANRALLLFPLLAFTSILSSPFNAFAAPELDSKELLKMSLAELSDIEVTSVSKKAEKETEAAAAIYVITKEDIKRSGATAIPELLRMAPGLTVTRAGAHDWAVAARGMNKQFSNKLLVLMDGRTIYSPLFAGVIWDTQDTMLEDIERIEVIRGPGATLWGANAVNGVINIITKNAKDTQGGLAVASAGNQVKGIGSVRYGVKTGDDSYVRAYAKQTDYNSESTLSGKTAGDSWKKSQAGFRGDLKVSDSDKLNVQGDVYAIDENSNYDAPDFTARSYARPVNGTNASGANLMARWERKISQESQISLQTYIDNTTYKTSFFNDIANTADIDFQHVWSGWKRQEIVWGAGYRFINSINDPASGQYALTPKTRNDNLFSAFVQDKITINPNDVFLTIGSKLESNDYTGGEIQPSARLSWLPTDNQTLWTAVSRAVHTPSRFTDDGKLGYGVLLPTVGLPFPKVMEGVGNRDLGSETLITYEVGYRVQPTKSSSLDVATFYNDYDKIFRDALGTSTLYTSPSLHSVVPAILSNSNAAHSMGVEVAGKWNVYDNWQLAGSYSYLDLIFKNKSGGVSTSSQGKQPKHQFNIRSNYRFSNGIEMDNALYFVDSLNGINVPDYYRFDTRLSYEITNDVEISLVGQNLLDDRHQEFSPFLYRRATEIGRSVYGSVSVKF